MEYLTRLQITNVLFHKMVRLKKETTAVFPKLVAHICVIMYTLRFKFN